MSRLENKGRAPLAVRFALFRWLFLLRKVFLTRSSRRYWSQYGEEIGLDRVLHRNRPGFFVDVGCYHPTKYSNTFNSIVAAGAGSTLTSMKSKSPRSTSAVPATLTSSP